MTKRPNKATPESETYLKTRDKAFLDNPHTYAK